MGVFGADAAPGVGPKSPPQQAPELPVALSSLTSLRMFAALAVFLFHTGLPHAKGGLSGVSFFFMLSGFVLTWARKSNDTVGLFWRRRAARILPLYFLCWFAAWALYTLLSEQVQVGRPLAGTFLAQSWVPVFRVYFAANGVSWSLSDEMFFYALFPFLVFAWARLSTRYVCAVLAVSAALAVAIPVIVHDPDANYYWVYIFPPVRALEFNIGICLALLIQRGWRTPVPLWGAALLASVAVLAADDVPPWLRPVALTLFPCALLVAAAATADITGSGGALLRRRWLVRLGEWSFAFYLVHQPVLNAIGKTIRIPRRVDEVMSLIVATALAGVLFQFVEKPLARRLRGGQGTPIIEADPATLALGSRL